MTSAGGFDVYVTKFDQFGNFIWAKRVGSTGNDTGYGIIIDPSGNLYVTGYFTATVDFNPGAGVNNLVTNGGVNADPYVLKLNSNGDYVWAQRMGGPNHEYSFNLALDPSGNLLVTGHMAAGVSTFPGQPSLTSAGGIFPGEWIPMLVGMCMLVDIPTGKQPAWLHSLLLGRMFLS
jgi:hypothetical protein